MPKYLAQCVLRSGFWLLVAALLIASAHAQVVGLQPTPVGIYTWNPTTNEWDQATSTSTANPAQNTPQAYAFYEWNAALGQWVPCTSLAACFTGGNVVGSLAATAPLQVNGGSGPATGAVTVSCPTCAVLPTGSTNQLLYYAAGGTTVTPLTLGTNLSISNGTLNAAAGSSVNVNGSAVTSPNFNGTTPAAPSGYTNVLWQVSNSSVSAYLPYLASPTQACPLGLGALVGAFTNSSGTIEGAPLCIGDGPISFQVPVNATQLQLGINDYNWGDNTGSLSIDVALNGGTPSAVAVGSTVGPWSTTTNPAYAYGITGGPLAPVIALSSLTAGDAVTLTYVSGTVTMCTSGCPATDANGWLTSPPGPAGSGGPTGNFYFTTPTYPANGYVPTAFMGSTYNSGAITALTGDGTASGPGSATFTLATVNSAPGTCGDATHVCQITTNGKGLTTSQTAVAISATGGVTSINTVAGAFTFTGSGVSCTSTTCTFSGGSGGAGAMPVNAQTGTSYTLVAGDVNANYIGMITMNNAAANTITIPPNSSVSFAVGTRIEAVQLGAGQTSFAAGSGVTIDTPTSLSARAQYSTICAVQVATDTWIACGDTQ